ncbi:MAG: hypothetical protein RL021_768 [Bacteroidota bacterium]|jgi:hypothetical protein
MNLLPGLWSLDSNSTLTNSGFFLQPNGQLELVGFETSGEWTLNGLDSLTFRTVAGTADTMSVSYKLVSIEADRMSLSGSDGEHLYRKVPFGLAPQEEVLTGYIGTLSSKQVERKHDATLPSAKKIGLRLITADTTLRLELLQGERNFSPEPSVEWRGILVSGGKFELKLSSTRPDKLTESGSEYELKIFGY